MKEKSSEKILKILSEDECLSHLYSTNEMFKKAMDKLIFESGDVKVCIYMFAELAKSCRIQQEEVSEMWRFENLRNKKTD